MLNKISQAQMEGQSRKIIGYSERKYTQAQKFSKPANVSI